MASPTAQSNPYTYLKASTLATRSLINPSDQKPIETTSSASHDHESAEEKPTLQRDPSSNYTQAVAAAGQIPPPQPTAGGDDRPTLGDRQQSWSMSDKRRQHHEQLMEGSPTSTAGYHSTSGGQ